MIKQAKWLSIIAISSIIASCSNDTTPINTDDPDLIMDFETKPLNPMPTRISDPNGNKNNCLHQVAFDQFYDYQICNAKNCPPEDLIIKRSQNPVRKGDNSLRFFMKPTPLNGWPGSVSNHRAELGPDYDTSFDPFPSVNDEYWYSFSIYFPNDFVFAPKEIESDVRFAIVQWQHGTPGPPIIALEVYGNQIALTREEGNSTDSKWKKPTNLTQIKKGQWMDFVIQVKWAKSNGYLRVWVDKEVVHEQANVQTIYSDLNRGGAFKFGIYYWRWKNYDDVAKSINAGINNREVFFDEINLYNGQNGYSVVAP